VWPRQAALCVLYSRVPDIKKKPMSLHAVHKQKHGTDQCRQHADSDRGAERGQNGHGGTNLNLGKNPNEQSNMHLKKTAKKLKQQQQQTVVRAFVTAPLALFAACRNSYSSQSSARLCETQESLDDLTDK
jgi:hypothetical protein